MNNKIILHIDMNSYYASMEQQAYPNLRGKPIGVAGKGSGERTVIVGASIEAKRLGVKGASSTWEAKRICPELIIVPANYARYSYTSKKIFDLFERFSPTVEVFSIDEAFIELPNKATWADGIAIAKQIKKLIRTQIGDWLTCSIGISYGRTLAKLGSELQKPNGLVVITPENFQSVTAKIAVQELCGVGFRIGPRLNQMGITTIGDLGLVPKAQLIQVFGDATGSWLYAIGNGVDDSKIRSFRELPQEKSIGHTYTVPRDLSSTNDAKKVLFLLSERVGRRLRRKNLVGQTVSVYLRFNDHTGWGEQTSQKEYVFDGLQIYRLAEKILNTLDHHQPIRLVGVTVSSLAQAKQTSAPLFEQQLSYERAVRSIDKINERYGEFTIHRGIIADVRARILALPDGRNKRLYIPNTSPFMKRVD